MYAHVTYRLEDDDLHLLREIRECTNILGAEYILPPSEEYVKALNRLRSKEFTLSDLQLITHQTRGAADLKIWRHAGIDTVFSKGVVEQTHQAMKRFNESVATLLELARACK